MLHPMVKKTIPWALSAALMVSTVPPHLVIAAESAATTAATPAVPVFSVPSIGKVSLGGASYIEVKGVQQLGRTVRFTVSFYNGGASELQFIDYWVRLRSASGSQFSPTLFEADKDKNRIAPKTTETFSFYASVSETTKLSDLTFDIIKWDFSVSSFQRTLGSLKIPATYQPVTPAGSVLSTTVNGVTAKAQVKRANVAKTSDKYVSSLVFEFENTGTKSFVIPAYEYAIVTSEGLTYPLTVSGLSENTSLHPRFKEELTLRGELPGTLENKNWQLVISEKQGEKMTVPAMSFFLPASTAEEVSDSVAVGSVKELLVSDQKIEAKVARTIRNENDKNFLAAIRFSFKNQGTKPVTLPKYTFQIETAAGLTYPVTADLSNVSVDPLVEREVELRATVPNSVGKDGWKLILNEPSDTTDPNSETSQLAKFDLPNDNPQNLGQGATYNYSNTDGTYGITLSSVQRVPWEDEDILSTEFVIKNSGTQSLPIPDLAGYFLLDNKIRVEAKLLVKDVLLAIQPGASISVQLYGKIPYTYNFSNVTAYLQEKEDKDSFINVIDFTTGNKFKAIPELKYGNKHSIKGTGRTSEVSIRDVRNYDASGDYFFTTLVDVKNMEKRATAIPTLIGHFETPDGLMFPATISKVTSKLSPQGVATLLVSSPIPKSVNTKTLALILGEGVVDDKLATNNDTPNAYINAVSYVLPIDRTEPMTTLKDMTFFPYTLTMEDIRAQTTHTDKYTFSFKYTLSKNSFVVAPTEKHTVTLRFKDNNSNEAFSKTFTFGDTDEEDILILGSHSKQIVIDDPALMYKLDILESFTVEIYDNFMGVEKLIAKQTANWNE